MGGVGDDLPRSISAEVNIGDSHREGSCHLRAPCPDGHFLELPRCGPPVDRANHCGYSTIWACLAQRVEFLAPYSSNPSTRPSRGPRRSLAVVPLIPDKRYYGEARSE